MVIYNEQLIITNMKKTFYFLVAIALITTSYLLMLGYFNRFVADDYIFISKVEDCGIWDFMVRNYNSWQCRFTYYLLIGFFYEIFGRCSNLILYTIIMLIIGWMSLYRVIRDFIPNMNKKMAGTLAVVVNNVAIMSFFEISTFFWVCTPDYFLLMYASLIIADVIFVNRLSLLSRWVLLLICSLYICGNLELYLAVLIFFVGIFTCYAFIRKPFSVLKKDSRFVMSLVMLFIFCVGFLIQYFGPGTQIRMQTWHSEEQGAADFLNDFSLLPYMIACVKAFCLLSLRFIFQLPYYVFIFVVFALIGYKFDSIFTKDTKSIRNRMLYAVLLFVIYYLCTIGISVLSLGSLAPIRSYTFLHYGFLVCIAYSALLLGSQKKNESIIYHSFVGVSSVLLFLTLCFMATEYPIARNFKDRIDSTLTYISNFQSDDPNDVIFVEPIKLDYIQTPYWYMRNTVKSKLSKADEEFDDIVGYFPYFPFTLSKNPQDFRNMGVKLYLGVQYDIVSKE